MNGECLIRGGRVVDPAQGVDEKRDLWIEDGRVRDLVPPGRIKAAKNRPLIIDASGCVVAPGFVDLHAHFREPGFEHKETLESGGRAAAAGGFTTVLCMANTDPPNDHPTVTRYIIERAEKGSPVRVLPVGALTRGLAGKDLAPYGALKEAGAVALSDDGRPVADARIMRHALAYARDFGLPVISHCEEPSLAGAMHEGSVSYRLGLPGTPPEAESVMVARDVELCRLAGGRLHVAHVSCRASLDFIRRAKEQGLAVTAEVTPHHLSFTHERVGDYDTSAKVNPPLRTEQDRDALRRALKEGLIDAIATDHAPHSVLEKSVPFEEAPFGLIGLETALPLTLQLVREKILALSEAVSALTAGPARIMNLGAGTLAAGARADVVIFDPDAEYTLSPGDIKSRGRNTPLLGAKLVGRVKYTLVGGRIVHEVP